MMVRTRVGVGYQWKRWSTREREMRESQMEIGAIFFHVRVGLWNLRNLENDGKSE